MLSLNTDWRSNKDHHINVLMSAIDTILFKEATLQELNDKLDSLINKIDS